MSRLLSISRSEDDRTTLHTLSSLGTSWDVCDSERGVQCGWTAIVSWRLCVLKRPPRLTFRNIVIGVKVLEQNWLVVHVIGHVEPLHSWSVLASSTLCSEGWSDRIHRDQIVVAIASVVAKC